MCLYPAKFLWTDLFLFWKDKSADSITQCVEILARMEVLTDPGEQMEQLVIVLAQRSLLGKCLLQVDRIKMSVGKLVRVLAKLAPLESETKCLPHGGLITVGAARSTEQQHGGDQGR